MKLCLLVLRLGLVCFVVLGCGSRKTADDDAPPAAASPVPPQAAVPLQEELAQRSPAAIDEPPAVTTDPSAAASSTASAPVSERCPMPLSSIRPLGAGRFQLERAEVLRVLDKFETDRSYWHRAVPEKVGDRVVGIRVFGLRPDGRCVLLSADRIESVDGIALDNQEHLEEIGARLRVAKRFVMNVWRKGESLRFEFQVR